MAPVCTKALCQERDRILFELSRLDRQMGELRRQLAHLERALDVVANDKRSERIRARPAKVLPNLRRGEIGRLCLDVLRAADGPLTLDEIVRGVCEQRGVPIGSLLYGRGRKAVFKALWDRGQSGTVAKERGARGMMVWRVTS